MTFNEALSAALADDNAPEYVKGLLSEIDRQAVALGNLHRMHTVDPTSTPNDRENSPVAQMYRTQRDFEIAQGNAVGARFYANELSKYLNGVFV